ncbi:heavy metal-binding domain-containing protein [Arundinibacter roseus]|uniref:Heavy metal binding domain-containing protein n=1 Tax=Arundinibacter roseus TaxID=2070510 RepID=A0A4R4K4W0_9BACT|nr:heavy metal-binding domain-containing protein [Arundinibacter roseus]TDB62313.1 hypothetical protein EZE20_18190 [Arundinibacter roseus]
MRKLIYLVAFSALLACSDKKENTETVTEETPAAVETTAAKHYACPMKCEGEKTYDAAGTCPVCKMDLAEVAMAEADSL